MVSKKGPSANVCPPLVNPKKHKSAATNTLTYKYSKV